MTIFGGEGLEIGGEGLEIGAGKQNRRKKEDRARREELVRAKKICVPGPPR